MSDNQRVRAFGDVVIRFGISSEEAAEAVRGLRKALNSCERRAESPAGAKQSSRRVRLRKKDTGQEEGMSGEGSEVKSISSTRRVRVRNRRSTEPSDTVLDAVKAQYFAAGYKAGEEDARKNPSVVTTDTLYRAEGVSVLNKAIYAAAGRTHPEHLVQIAQGYRFSLHRDHPARRVLFRVMISSSSRTGGGMDGVFGVEYGIDCLYLDNVKSQHASLVRIITGVAEKALPYVLCLNFVESFARFLQAEVKFYSARPGRGGATIRDVQQPCVDWARVVQDALIALGYQLG